MRLTLPAALVLALVCSTPAWAQQSALTAPLGAPVDPIAYYRDRASALAAIDAENYQAAESLFEHLTAAYPLDAECWWGLAVAKRRLGKPREAIAAYAHVIDLAGPIYRRARLRTAMLQLEAGDTDGALATLDQLVFQNAYLDRPSLLSDDAFAPLRDAPRFREIAGAIDVSALSREQGWRLDLDFLMSEIRRLSPRHRQGALPADLIALHRDLYDNVSRLSDEQMFAGLARMVGTLDMNHTMLWGLSPDAAHPTLHYLPLQFYFFPEGAFIVGAGAQSRDLIGAQVLSIDGTPVLDVLARARETMSVGSDSEALWAGPIRLMDTSLLNGLGVTRRADRATLRLRLRNGRTITRVVDATPTPIFGKLPPPPGVEAPPFLSRVPDAHWFQTWPDGAIYAQGNQIAPGQDETLDDFGLRLRRALTEAHARDLIIDLRHNNGGDTTTYVELLRTIIAFSAEDDHQVYVLIGRNTYSAAVNLCSDIERLADPIFVGEPTSATGNQEGDEGNIRLPYSGLRGTISGLLWQFGYPFDARRFIAPEAPVPLTAAAYFAGHDPALDTVRMMIAARSR